MNVLTYRVTNIIWEWPRSGLPTSDIIDIPWVDDENVEDELVDQLEMANGERIISLEWEPVDYA